jgi:hypothetical protein
LQAFYNAWLDYYNRIGKITKVFDAWKDLCPTKSFAGMTLAQFKAKIQPSLDARNDIDTLADEMTAALVRRDAADVESMKQVSLVVNSAKGDPDEGEDRKFYAASGYVRKSDCKTGKANKPKKTDSGTTKP